MNRLGLGYLYDKFLQGPLLWFRHRSLWKASRQANRPGASSTPASGMTSRANPN